jgi:hypothetical protein
MACSRANFTFTYPDWFARWEIFLKISKITLSCKIIIYLRARARTHTHTHTLSLSLFHSSLLSSHLFLLPLFRSLFLSFECRCKLRARYMQQASIKIHRNVNVSDKKNVKGQSDTTAPLSLSCLSVSTRNKYKFQFRCIKVFGFLPGVVVRSETKLSGLLVCPIIRVSQGTESIQCTGRSCCGNRRWWNRFHTDGQFIQAGKGPALTCYSTGSYVGVDNSADRIQDPKTFSLNSGRWTS